MLARASISRLPPPAELQERSTSQNTDKNIEPIKYKTHSVKEDVNRDIDRYWTTSLFRIRKSNDDSRPKLSKTAPADPRLAHDSATATPSQSFARRP